MIAGSSGLLAVETLSFSSSKVERNVDVDVASDENAYLGLEANTSEDVETGGVLFENGAERCPIVSFDVINQLPESLSLAIELEDDRFRFVDDADNVEIDDGRLRTEELGPGDKISVGIDLDLRSDQSVGESITTALEIEATGETTHIETERTLTLQTEC
ncbi:hypothetical protein ATJ93_2679 [Halopiger aswanensis]|uniref:DUF1102 domain-containing protein n=2 Tax=Halopiger aswanensis TaxID=148449 RepID=A0A419WK80_9EURY|nr:hypothetical protein ATJ93_2679 [Halopiger aswanensis]